jgi:hypothetical protein
MTNPPKARGTRAETAVVKVFTAAGIPAERTPLKGAGDVGDIWVAGGRMVVEVKSRRTLPSHAEIRRFYQEMTREASRVPQCDIGVLVVKRPGSGKAGNWWAFMDHAEWVWIARAVDGDPSFPMMLTVDTLIGQLVRLGWAA